MLIEELTGTLETGIMYGDNEAAIYLSKNKHVSARTKHIDIKNHYVRDHVEEGRAVIRGERTENNFADILTKNTTIAIFKKLSEAILKGFQGWEEKFKWKGHSVNMIRMQNHNAHDQRQRENVVNNISHQNRNQIQHQSIKKYLTKNDKNNIQNKCKFEKENKRAKYNGKNSNNVHTWTSYGAHQYRNAHKNYAHKNYAQVCADHAHEVKKDQTDQNFFEKPRPRIINVEISIPVDERTPSSLCNKVNKSSTSEARYKQTIGTKMNCSKLGTSKCSNRGSCGGEVENSRAGIKFNTEAQETPFQQNIQIKITFD
jgi:hypothetical protein